MCRPPSSSSLFFSSLISSPFRICTPEGVVCLLTSWSKASTGLCLAPIIRAWQGAAVLTCQPNKHPLWHPPGCVLRGVSQPPSSGPLISWMAHSVYTSTRLLCTGQAAIVLPCTAILMTLTLLEAFRLVWDVVIERKSRKGKEGELKRSPTWVMYGSTGGIRTFNHFFRSLHKSFCNFFLRSRSISFSHFPFLCNLIPCFS